MSDAPTKEERADWDLDTTTAYLHFDYAEWKTYEKEKNADKDCFYELADEELAKEPVAENYDCMVILDGDTEGDVLDRIRRFNPGWDISEHRLSDADNERYEVEAILVEDISLKPFTYVNRELDPPMVFKRSVSAGSPMLDEVFLQRADPKLWEEVSFETPWGERIMPPLTVLDSKLVSRIQKYIYNGKPKVSLSPPREAKTEELE
jgi:hypothetical protein